MPSLSAERLFEQHHVAIYRYLLRMTGSADVAEELTQDVFVRVVQGLGRYEAIDRERAWLFRIARNLHIDYVRGRRRTPPPATLDGLDGVDVSDPAIQGVRSELIRALADLVEDDREAFLLAEVGGLSYAEIADVCGATVAAVRSRIYRARQALRISLEGVAVDRRPLVRGSHA